MKLRVLINTLLFLFVLNTSVALADDDAIATMAGVMLGFNHFPSADQKVSLQEIVDSDQSSGTEKTLATAILLMQHQATDADKKSLEQIVNDASGSAETRDLASVIHDVQHQANSEQKEILQKILQM